MPRVTSEHRGPRCDRLDPNCSQLFLLLAPPADSVRIRRDGCRARICKDALLLIVDHCRFDAKIRYSPNPDYVLRAASFTCCWRMKMSDASLDHCYCATARTTEGAAAPPPMLAQVLEVEAPHANMVHRNHRRDPHRLYMRLVDYRVSGGTTMSKCKLVKIVSARQDTRRWARPFGDATS